MITHPGALRTD